jgi:DNA polymerase III subunit delta
MIKILEGENSFLSKERLKFLIEEFQSKQYSVKTINAETTDASEIIQEYQTKDIFSEKKVLVIKRLMLNKQYKDIVEKIHEELNFDNENDVILWEENNIPKNTRYYKLFKAKNCMESFPKFNRRTFLNWAKEQTLLRKLEIDPKTLEDLIIMTNYDPYNFLNEINKFEILDIKKIEGHHLKKFINSVHDYDIWTFIDAMNHQNNQKEVLDILSNLLEKKISAPYLITMIARNLKQIILTNKLLDEGKTDREIVSIIKIPPFILPRIKSVAKESSYTNLLAIYEKVYRLDYEIKIGNINEEMGLILLTTRF